MKIITRRLSSLAACAIFTAACLAQDVTPPPASPDPAPPQLAQAPTDTLATTHVSQVRIVRLSQVKGQVQLDRGTDQKFELAFTNLPIIAGERLRTQQGLAEVEFPVLGRNPGGSFKTAVKLSSGSLYISLSASKNPADFTLLAGNESITLNPSSHLRLDIDKDEAKLVVFQGNVTVNDPSGSMIVAKHKAISFGMNSTEAPVLAGYEEPGSFDTWDKNAVDYHKARTVAAGFASTPYGYGVNDLAYYGAFSDVGGCGTMWTPYLAGASFDPFANGVWSWYPGAGYSYVSLYPWGWTPFHYGSWNYCGNRWGWTPQGGTRTWNGLGNHGILPTRGPGRRPILPNPPVAGHSTLIAINSKPMPISKPGSGSSFEFHESAGLGVPRGVFNLAKISQHVGPTGIVTENVSDVKAQAGLIATPHLMATVASVHSASPGVSSGGSGGTHGSTATSSFNSSRSSSFGSTSSGSASMGSMHSSSSMSSSSSSSSFSGGSSTSSSMSSSMSSGASSGASSGGSHH